MAVSNAAEVSREPGRRPASSWSPSPTPCRMSTYLLALVVGPLEATEARTVPGRDGPVRAARRPPAGQARTCADFALEVAEAALGFFEDYYDLPYPGDKVDLVAVPDFAFGAMENLGCVTFREVLLLVDPDTATPRELQRVADVINHELAHMWFGDLVTMKWWNGIWLNEAFATFMEVSATRRVPPGVGRLDHLRARPRQRRSRPTRCARTRPVEYEVVTAADAEAMFDILTYEKGCSVVRMLEQYLGPERFRDGIRRYLRLNAVGQHRHHRPVGCARGGHRRAGAQDHGRVDPPRRAPLVTVDWPTAGVRLDQQRAGASRPDRRFGPTGAARSPSGSRCPCVIETRPAVGRMPPARRSCWTRPTEVRPSHGDPPWSSRTSGGNGFFRTLLDTPARDVRSPARGPRLERFVLLDDTWFAHPHRAHRPGRTRWPPSRRWSDAGGGRSLRVAAHRSGLRRPATASGGRGTGADRAWVRGC